MAKTNTKRSRKHRENLKKNAKRHEEAKKRDRVRKQKARSELRKTADNNTLLKIREKKRLEMKKYREKKKANTLANNRENSGKQKNAKIKQSQRKKRYNEKKKAEKLKKEKAVIRTQKWRMRIQLKTGNNSETGSADGRENSETESPNAKFKNRMAENRAIRKVKEKLPKTPKKRAIIIQKLADSPSCSKFLKDKMMTPENIENAEIGKNFVKSMSSLYSSTKVTRNEAHIKARRTLKNILNESLKGSKSKRKTEKKVGFFKPRKVSGLAWWINKERKTRKDKISWKVKKEITDFYTSGEVSRELPDKKNVSKNTNIGKIVMTMTIKDAHLMYKKKYPDSKVGLTTFYKLKPRNIKVSETNRRCCLCQICCNVALKVEAANKFIIGKDREIQSLTK